jgi:phosphoribosylanthranilate isomerase
MKIKVCGMRDPENIVRVGQLDIDWMGFIFHPRSPRYIPDDDAPYLSPALHRCTKVLRVGVFVDAGTDEILARAARWRLNYVQLHGSESPADCHVLQQQGYPVIKAFAIEVEDDLKRTDAYAACARYFLFDTKTAAYGGSGQRFDWSLLQSYRGATPFLLSGGIGPDSIPGLRRLAHPQMAGIDLNSRFEIAPALKDALALAHFIHQFRNIKYP